MLNEYAEDSEGAIASLEKAEKKYPKNVRLIRERAKIYYGKGDHATALATIEEVADAIPKDDHIERAFAFRDAGISAMKIEEFAKAAHFFSEACEAASTATDDMKPMAIGLKGDKAIAQFQLGEKDEALNLMRQALIDAEQLNPEAGKKEKYCTLVLGHVILWMQKQVNPNLLSKIDVQIVPGCCSNPEPSEKVIEMKSPPFLVYWYQLALLEVMLGINSGIMDELRKRTSKQKILSYELILNHYLIAKHIVTVDIENFFSYLAEYVSKAAYMRENAPNASKGNNYDLTDANLSAIKPVDWKSDLHLQIAKDAILTLIIVAFCTNANDVREQILKHVVQNKEADIALRDFLDCLGKEIQTKGNIFDEIASQLRYLMNIKEDLIPDKMFIITCRFWEWLLNARFKDIVEDMIANYLIQRWQTIIKNQRFLLQQPIRAVPAIESAIEESVKGSVKIAKLLLAAEIAISKKLSVKLRSDLKEHCLQTTKKNSQLST